MAIPKWAKANFATLCRAVKNDDIALAQCTDKKTGKVRYVLTAMQQVGAEWEMVPFGHLVKSPYEEYSPSKED